MTYYLGIGSNLGDREGRLLRACQLIEERVGVVSARSSFFYSAPVGFSSPHDFVNLCIAVQSSHTPMQVLLLTQQIEREMGRTLKSSLDSEGRPVYHDRVIDIDLLHVFDADGHEYTCSTEQLTLPHPHIGEREFVRIPLSEILH